MEEEATAKENPKQNIEKIESEVSRDIEEAENYESTHVSVQRARGYEYYYGDKIGNEASGKSQHISMDVFNVVETAKALCLETFTVNSDAVYFPPQNADDYYKSKQATAYTNYVFYRENKGYEIMHDWLHDGFLAKNGIVKRWWKEELTLRIETFEEITEQNIQALSQVEGVEIKDIQEVQVDVPQYAPMPMMPQGPPQGGPPQGGGGAPPQGPPPPGGQGVPPSGPPNPQMSPAMNPQSQGGPMNAPGAAPPPMGSSGVPPMPPGQPPGPPMGGPPQQPPIIGMNQEMRYSGEIIREVDTSHVAIENIAPEDFIVEKYATSLEKARFCAQRKVMTKSECLEMGWSPEIVDKLNFGEVQVWIGEREKQARHDFDKTYDPVLGANSSNRAADKANVYECYKKMDIDGDGIEELYQIYYSSKRVLQIDRVDEIPFEVFKPYPQPHKYDGLSIPDIIWNIQKTKSTIERQIIDNMVLTNNPRYLADIGFIRNPKDLLHNKAGTVINTTDMNAVKPMEQAMLNPQSFSVLEMLNNDKEEATGATKLAQGMEKDAISKQNSFDTIQALTTAANRRLMMFARHFAEYSLKPLFEAIYRLGMKYEKKEKFVLLNGTYVPVRPEEFESRTDLQVRVALTPTEQQEQVQGLTMLHQQLMQTPTMQLSYGPKQQYELFLKMMENLNIDCREILLQSPDSPEYLMAQQAQSQMMQQEKMKQDQMLGLEAQLKQAQAMNLNMDSQTSQFKAQTQNQEDMLKIQQTRAKHGDDLEIDAEKMGIDQQRADSDEWYKNNQIRIADAELVIKQNGGTGI